MTDFGDVLVSYWDPVKVDEQTGAVWVGRVNNYTSGLKIDFGSWSPPRYFDVTTDPIPPRFDAGHRVPVDKAGLTAGPPPAMHRAYVPRPPDEAAYWTLITDVLIGVPT